MIIKCAKRFYPTPKITFDSATNSRNYSKQKDKNRTHARAHTHLQHTHTNARFAHSIYLAVRNARKDSSEVLEG